MRNCRGETSWSPGAGTAPAAGIAEGVAAAVTTAVVAGVPVAGAEFAVLAPGIAAFIAASWSACSLIRARSCLISASSSVLVGADALALFVFVGLLSVFASDGALSSARRSAMAAGAANIPRTRIHVAIFRIRFFLEFETLTHNLDV